MWPSSYAVCLCTKGIFSMALIAALRPKQWTKNLLVYLPLFFTVGERWSPQELGEALDMIGRSTAALALFTVISGAVYLVNDVADLDSDRQHPQKRDRPIASGRLGIPVALVVSLALAAGGVAASFALEALLGWVALGYLGLMTAYSLILKRLVLLDVITVAGGFLLRVVAGAAVLGVLISPWLYACSGLGALFIALAKRRSEAAAAGEDAATQREALGAYTLPLLDQLMAVIAASALLAYTLYTFTASNLPDNHAMMLTIPFVVFGLFRYTYLVHKGLLGEEPEEMLARDAPLFASVVLWLVAVAAILVLFRA